MEIKDLLEKNKLKDAPRFQHIKSERTDKGNQLIHVLDTKLNQKNIHRFPASPAINPEEFVAGLNKHPHIAFEKE